MEIIDREIQKRILQDFQNVTICDKTVESDIIKTGKNYCSKGSRFTISFQKDGKECEKSFFLKVPYEVQHYQLLKQLQLYAKEIYMYEVVFPIYKSFLLNDSLYPEFYGTDGKDALILEDISKSGYQMLESHKQMDFEHCAMALKLLAKFHAFSVKIHETKPQILDKVRNELILTSTFFQSKEYCTLIHNRLQKVVHRAAPSFAAEHPQVLQFLTTNSNLVKIVIRESREQMNSFSVLNHGDFHTNNIMFAYDACGQVINAKCVDFQLCKWASPAVDILYFSMICMQPRVFEKYFPLLLEIYVSTLNVTLKFLKSNQKLEMITLQKDIQKLNAYRLYTLVGIAPLLISDGKSIGEGMGEEFLDDDNYIELTKFWIPYFIKEGVFSKYEDTAIAIDQFTRKFQNNNKTTISKYDLEYDLVNPGDNYCSEIIRMKFEFQKNEKTVQSSVLLKIPSLSENYDKIEVMGIYHHEVIMYEKVLPELFDLWNGQHFVPICHAVTTNQVLVLEDLKAQGYHTCDRKNQLDFDHCCLALRTLAKYHALSVKYIQNSNHTLNDVLTKLPAYSTFLTNFGQILYGNFLHIAKNLVSESIYKTLCEYKVDKFEEMRLSTFGESDFSVIVHGDFWTNNILFKYNDDGQVHDVKMIDWQMSRKAKPFYDLIHFFASSVQFEVFAVHRNTLLNIYIDTLNETLSMLQCNCDYTRTDLDKDFEEYKILFLYIVSTYLQMLITKVDSPAFRSVDSKEISSGNYPAVLAKWLNYFVENGIII